MAMTADVGLLLALIWTHFVADFILQTDSMAQKKSTSNAWLLAHIAVYTAPFFYFGWLFALVNGLSHLAVDWCTSRINSRLWKAGEVHWFFVGVGADQAIHVSILILTMELVR
jgi:hypothetical protein